MQLKTYQQNALEQLDRWFDALKEGRKETADAEKFYAKKKKPVPEETKNFPRTAWKNLKDEGVLPGIPKDGNITTPGYISRTAASDEPIPHVCLKVPTGGGKTLLGVSALSRITQETGFVLWIVPTRAIYAQTIKAFKTREHPYRQMLERISGGRVKLLEKHNRFTKQGVESHLCVMMLMLPSANRQKNRDFLKIFKDSGEYTSFFPEQDDMTANKMLLEQYPDLDKTNATKVKQSLFNTLKLIRPTVILDEAHKAYGRDNKKNKEFVKSVNQLNPRFVLELSATPKLGISNILVDISGTELQDEEMIKLPIEIRSFENSNWKYTLEKTKEKLNGLKSEAEKLQTRENRYVRPIALVRVQRTDKGQEDTKYIHAENVRKYLIQNLKVPEDQIRIQSSKQKGLAGEDLLSDMSQVRWIITKDALKEGWDCSFAYILALLDNTKAKTAVTQMVGRVMRQPHARSIKKSDALNRCYIYCYNYDVGEAVEWVKSGLESEGLSGLGNAIRGEGGESAPKKITVKRRTKYKQLKIFLPQVLHKQGKRWRLIDYDRDITSAIDWGKLNGGEAVDLNDENTIQEIKATVDIYGQSKSSGPKDIDSGEQLTLDYFVRQLIDIIPNPWQAARIAEEFIRKYKKKGADDTKLLANRIYLSKILQDRMRDTINKTAETIFFNKVTDNEIRFHLETDEQLDYDLNKSFEVFVSCEDRVLQGNYGQSIQQSLFDKIFEGDLNTLEKDFALYLDKSNAIFWWHRIASRQAYSLQGWQKNRVYPDFVACRKGNRKLLILETKGNQYKGNKDTIYKKKLLETLEEAYKNAIDRGKMKVKESPAVFRIMFENNWREKIGKVINE